VSGKEPKLLYHSKQFRFRVQLHSDYCRKHPKPEENIRKRCQSKLAQLKSEELIEDHMFDESTYLKTWQLLSKPDSQVESVIFTIGLGIPSLKWLVIKRGEVGVLCRLSLLDREAALSLGIQAFMMIVKRKLIRAHIIELPNEAQLQACYLRLVSGWTVEEIPITAQTPFSEVQDKSITVSINKSRCEVSLVIRTPKAFLSLSEDSLLELSHKSALTLRNETGSEIRTNPDILKDIWSELKASPLALGLGAPKAIVIAFGNWSDKAKLNSTGIAPGHSGNFSELNPGAPNRIGNDHPMAEWDQSAKGDLTIELSHNNTMATVVRFQRSIYENPNLSLTEEWLDLQISRLGINQEAFIPYKSQVLFALESQKDLSGMTLAAGSDGFPGEEPYLYPTFKHTREKFIKDHEGDFIDVRNLQSSEVVNAGDLVAEICYKKPAKPGRDVFGRALAAPVSGSLKINIGPGLQAQKGGRIFATEPGKPVIKGLSISLQKIYVHQGDVTLKSGNISYDGPVEIYGNIDRGASVIAQGPIAIFGNVEGGIVKSATSIFVQGGVITTDKGKLEAAGDIQAYHVENSRIYCGGTIKVEKVLLNSNVFAGIGIEVSPKNGGIIAGGNLTATGHLYTFNLGLKNGATTVVNIGCDWKNEYSYHIAQTRIERINLASEKDRSNLRDLTSRKLNQLSQKHLEMKTEIQNKLIKSRRIVNKLANRLQDLKLKIKVNPKAEIVVHNLLFANCQVKITNKSAAIPHDFREVAITSNSQNGTYIVSLDYFLKVTKHKEIN